jgi:hypothetical protein
MDNGINADNEMNNPITINEIKEALSKLKLGKACGADGILAEMLKVAGEKIAVLEFMRKLFNKIFNDGQYPESWAKAIIVPIFKKGEKSSTDNYRGISLLSLVSKCYTYIINKRLNTWTEKNKKVCEAQGGFRKGYSTTDHIFTLNAVIERCTSKRKGKLYACFVDLKKAFDTVHRRSLFGILQKAGLPGKFYNAIAAVYKTVLSCVRVNSDLTDFFECPSGVRQGCILSPVLFSLFINEIASAVDQEGLHSIQLLPGLVELFLLLFADDIVLLSTSPLGLQRQINLLTNACKDLNLTVNSDKTKVMVFRKGGPLSRKLSWNLEGNPLEIVNQYNYLGFTFTTQMSFNKGVDVLAAKGKRACADCIRCLRKISDVSKKCFFKIFDTQVQPVVLYAAEIWGMDRLINVERVHTYACKRYLNVTPKMPNKFVYGETGRYPLYVNSAVRCIRYWLKLLKLDMSRLPKQAYRMLINLDGRGNRCWVSKVRSMLFDLGLGEAWIQQSVGCEQTFVMLFKERMIESFEREWSNSITTKDMYSNYRQFKSVFRAERYFDFVSIKCFRDCVVKLRLGLLPLKYSAFKTMFVEDIQDRYCFCGQIEDEKHFVCSCPLYHNIRNKYLKNVTNVPLVNSFHDLLRCDNEQNARSLGMFLFHALRSREILYDT